MYVMREAMLAMSVPRPPKLVPTTSASPLSVKADRSIAAGTLLMICEAATAVSTGETATTFDSALYTASMRPILPISTVVDVFECLAVDYDYHCAHGGEHHDPVDDVSDGEYAHGEKYHAYCEFLRVRDGHFGDVLVFGFLVLTQKYNRECREYKRYCAVGQHELNEGQ